MLPNWIIAGAPKSATTSLFHWLVDHPYVAGSREKETYYFSDPGSHMYRPHSNFTRHGLAGYEALFAHCPPSSRVILESTPGYMYAETALREMPGLPSRPQFIFLLREPVAQLKSLFGYLQENWNYVPRDMTFRQFVRAAEMRSHGFNGNEQAADALVNADYAPHLRRWRDACGPERIHVFLFEEMVTDKAGFMRRLSRTLGIDPAFYDDYAFPSENVSYVARSKLLQDINIWARARLPQGRAYRALRHAYRKLNTRPAATQASRDLDLEAGLSERYLATADALERDFGLDVSGWRKTLRARIALAEAARDERHPTEAAGQAA